MTTTQSNTWMLPADDRSNGWSAILSPRTPRPPVSKDETFDWLVIGGGYAGLAAARRLATLNPTQTIGVLEAQQCGEGAQGRNAGFAIDLPHNGDHDPANPEKGHRNMRLSRFGISYLEAVIAEHSIACQWSKRGRFDAAVSPEMTRKLLRPTMSELDALGESYEFLQGDALAARIGTAYYDAAIFTPGTRLLNPAALTRALAETLPASVQLFENSPVLALETSPNIVATVASGASVRARKVILGNNAFINRFGYFRGRALPFVLFASMTRPLAAEERQRIGNVSDWGITPAHALAGPTLRYTQDHRILVRYGFAYAPTLRHSPELRAHMQQAHRERFRERFPTLPNVGFEHFWAGYLAMSRNGAPGWGKLAENVYAAVICSGVGIAKQTAAGVLAAELASDTEHPYIEDMLKQGTPAPLPRRPFLDVGVRAYVAAEKWRGRSER
ncbi:NAD(P)/FAD-dependent oxidoreductase [Pandoraea pneumonica]|uniref:NAD(P)/FAD-dependent oxidoreductase n=1 Tax=Pandoraea pneumonica TaxID=2508299 RepID=UPI003CFB3D56